MMNHTDFPIISVLFKWASYLSVQTGGHKDSLRKTQQMRGVINAGYDMSPGYVIGFLFSRWCEQCRQWCVL